MGGLITEVIKGVMYYDDDVDYGYGEWRNMQLIKREKWLPKRQS